MNKIVKNTFCLTGITIALGLVLGYFHDITLEPIAQQELLQKQTACKEVYTQADHFNFVEITDTLQTSFDEAILTRELTQETVDDVYEAVDASENLLGYVITVTTKEGYGGDIQLSVGISADGTIQGIYFLSISETAGLGMRADTDEFKDQFQGIQSSEIQYVKTGAQSDDEIDALSGATVTTNAVTNGVNAGLAAFEVLQEGGAA